MIATTDSNCWIAINRSGVSIKSDERIVTDVVFLFLLSWGFAACPPGCAMRAFRFGKSNRHLPSPFVGRRQPIYMKFCKALLLLFGQESEECRCLTLLPRPAVRTTSRGDVHCLGGYLLGVQKIAQLLIQLYSPKLFDHSPHLFRGF